MNKLLKISGVFSIASSIGMIGFWVLDFIFKFHGDGLQVNSISFWFLIGDEALTSIGLFTGGIGLFLQKKWGTKLFYISMGMMLYAVIYASGIFTVTGNFYIGSFFIIIAIVIIVLLAVHLVIIKKIK